MIPAPSYKHIKDILNKERFWVDSTDDRFEAQGVPSAARTVGFILFDQNFEREAIRDTMRNLDTLNLHSGEHMHFFLCGVSMYGKNESNAQELGTLDGAALYHNAAAAKTFSDVFEKEIPDWKYNVGLHLILVDIIGKNGEKRLQFRSAVFFKVDELIRIRLIERPSELFVKLVHLYRSGNFENAKSLRDELRRLHGINWFKGLLLQLFPNSVGKWARAEAAIGGGAPIPD